MDLEKQKELQLAKYQRKPRSGGIRGKKKTVLEDETRELRAELKQLKAENVAAKVEMAMVQMPLDLKRKLGLL